MHADTRRNITNHRVNAAFLRRIDRVYTAALKWSMRHRWVIVLVCFGALYSIPIIGKRVPFNFLPTDDESQMQVTFTAPEGSSLEATRTIARRMDEMIRKMPGIKYTLLTVGGSSSGQQGAVETNTGSIYVQMSAAG